jgi:signal transduction histidine kinase
MPRSASARLSALYTAAFVGAVVMLGGVTLMTTRAALSTQFDARIRSEGAALAQEFQTDGVAGIAQDVQERQRTPGALDYGLEGPGHRPIAGGLVGTGAPPGWSELRIRQPTGATQRLRVYVSDLGHGYRVLVGDNDESIEAVDKVLAERLLLAILGVAAIGVAGGYWFGRGMRRRISAITRAAEGIIDGDLSRRVPVRGKSDDLDHLAATFNRMLDRIESLMESLRQVSNDVAHDLRTPLTRLRARLESQLSRAAPGTDPGLDAALADLDAILATFAALLRIAQIEGGARRAGFRPTDLAAVGRTVVEAFAPSAEDAGVALRLEARAPVMVEGDSELLTQMVVNLVENGLRHAGPGALVRVRVNMEGKAPSLAVTDNGPGVPDHERERLFDRFYRLERSRSTPGSGLGLALVSAVGKLHGATVALHDADPGLEARVTFVAAA